jgi:hypothetical protein
MAKQLPDSSLDRSNILNNNLALDTLKEHLQINGVVFEDELKYTAKQVADFYGVDRKTVNRYLTSHADELRSNGYEVYSGVKLQMFKEFGRDIDVPTKTTVIGVFNFKAFINLGLLLQESERARILRRAILDLVLDVVSANAGGNTKYINHQDESYMMSLYLGENYREQFKNALASYVDEGQYKIASYTNEIYKSIFKERAQDYKELLSLDKHENVRDTMYTEVITTISMYETGLAYEIEKKYKDVGRKLTSSEVKQIFREFSENPIWIPQLEMVRVKMASRDYGLRSVKHKKLEKYISPMDSADFEKFLGKKSQELGVQLTKHQDVLKRLKDK